MPRFCTSCCHPCAGLRHACCIAVHDNPCKWYPGLPPNPRHPEWGSGFLSENSQDAAYGDDPHQTCEHLVLEGDDDGNTYTCQRDFCETCGERAGWCDAYCGICRSMADPLRGDFPGTRCMSKLIEDTELYREHCISCVTDDATQEMTCTPSCGDVTFTPPCDMCTNDSGFGSNDCETLVGMGVACTRDLGVLTSLFAGVLLQDRCQVTCGICECPAERTINCNSDVVQGDSGIMHAVLSECFGQESSVVRAGYSPFLQCAREAAAVCEPLDCLNLYYDVRDACFGGVLGQRCGFPGPSNGIPTECERAIGVMVGNADRCVGLTPDSLSGHITLGGTDLGPTQTFAQVAAQTRAACMGCDLNAVYEACGRPEWGGGTSADIWDSCSPACGSVAVPFFLNYQSHDNECAGFWSAAGLSAEYEVGGIPGAIERLYNTCNVPCTGVMSPYLGSFGTCNEDGTLAMGSTCEVSCESGATLQGVQPFCMAGGHLVVAGTENGVQTPWEAGSCGCSHDHYQNQLQQACQPCSICPLAKFESKNVVTIILVTEHVYSLERTTHSAFPANDVKPARRATLTTLHTAAKTAEPARRNFHRWLHAHTSVTRSVPGHVMYLLPTAATLERVQTVPWNMVPPAILHAALDICWTLLIKTNRNVGPTAGSSLEAQ
jgi:hypothetical protein